MTNPNTTPSANANRPVDLQIMPDGRPLYAWQNELEMLRAKEPRANERLKEAHHLAKLAGIAEVFREQNPYNREMIIRVRFQRFMSSVSRDPLDSAEVLPPLSKYPKPE